MLTTTEIQATKIAKGTKVVVDDGTSVRNATVCEGPRSESHPSFAYRVQFADGTMKAVYAEDVYLI